VFHQYTVKISSPLAPLPPAGGRSPGGNLDVSSSELIDGYSLRNKVRAKLAEKGIPTMVYYPIELHKQKAFAKYWDGMERFPVSEQLVQTVLSLPMHTEMTREMVEYVCEAVIESIVHTPFIGSTSILGL
jgi:hypothetical protein